MLRLAELAALGYSSWVIVAQVVKVRLVAVVAGLNSHLHEVFLHGKFSSLNLYVNIIAGNSDLSKNFLLRRSVISEDKITLDFIEFFQVFKRFSGETVFITSVLPLKPGFNLAYAAKMHGCQGKNAAKAQEILPFTIVFNRF